MVLSYWLGSCYILLFAISVADIRQLSTKVHQLPESNEEHIWYQVFRIFAISLDFGAIIGIVYFLLKPNGQLTGFISALLSVVYVFMSLWFSVLMRYFNREAQSSSEYVQGPLSRWDGADSTAKLSRDTFQTELKEDRIRTIMAHADINSDEKAGLIIEIMEPDVPPADDSFFVREGRRVLKLSIAVLHRNHLHGLFDLMRLWHFDPEGERIIAWNDEWGPYSEALGDRQAVPKFIAMFMEQLSGGKFAEQAYIAPYKTGEKEAWALRLGDKYDESKENAQMELLPKVEEIIADVDMKSNAKAFALVDLLKHTEPPVAESDTVYLNVGSEFLAASLELLHQAKAESLMNLFELWYFDNEEKKIAKWAEVSGVAPTLKYVDTSISGTFKSWFVYQLSTSSAEAGKLVDKAYDALDSEQIDIWNQIVNGLAADSGGEDTK